MQREPKRKMQDVLVARQRRKAWLKVAGVMMAVVVFCTTYALILPAITMGNKAYCGIEEHTHTEACYTIQEVPKLAFVCKTEEDADFILHTHDEICYDDAGQLICTLTERQAHTHDEACYDENGELICSKPEVNEHVHEEQCYNEDGILICGQALVIAHQHSEECLGESSETEEVSVLTCTKEEHTHIDQCFVQPESLTFTYSDDSVSGTITVPWSEELPKDLNCTVVILQEDDEEYAHMLASIDKTLATQNMADSDVQVYQLEWQSEGEDYTLPEDITPTVELVANNLEDDETLTGLVISEEESEQASTAATTSRRRAAAKTTNSSGSAVSVVNSFDEDSDDSELGEILTTAEGGDDPMKDLPKENESSMSSATEADSGDETDDAVTTYVATSVAAEEETVTFSMRAAARTFAVARSRALPAGIAYYKRVDSLSEMQGASGKGEETGYYVIVSVDGTLALGQENVYMNSNYGGNKSKNYAAWNSSQVTVHPVRDANNSEYFVIRDSSGYIDPTSDSAIHWIFRDFRNSSTYDDYYWATSPYFQIKNKSTGGNLWMGYDYYSYEWASWKYFWSVGMMLERQSTEDTWRIIAKADRYGSSTYQDTWYLTYIHSSSNTNLSEGYISQHNQNDHGITDGSGYFYDLDFEDNFEIYKYVGTNLVNYDDEKKAEEVAENSKDAQAAQATKPESVETTSTTASKQGTVTSTTTLTGATLSYASDKATSTIEDQFLLSGSDLSGDSLHAQQAKNDGRVVTDKSVIYGDDDYDAFDSYQEDEFSVALSALGQEWTITEETEITTPIDVVFVLDLSGSMIGEYDGVARWQSSVNALNTISNEILSRDSENRVGLVAFSNNVIQALNLDHYDTSSTDGDALLSYTSGSWSSLRTSYNLKSSSGNTVSSVYLGSKSDGLWSQTFTQAGLQSAYQMFNAVKDTTVKRKNGSGEWEDVTRQPVIILLSDGDPTLGTYDYMNPEAGPVYGWGSPDEFFGYYSVLSANYFKNMTSIKYNLTAKFFSIGLDIDDSTALGQYTQAVLDPSPERLEQIYSWSVFSQMLTDKSDTILLDSTRWRNAVMYGTITGRGVTNDVLSVNPSVAYDDVSYADDAFFGDMTEEEITQILENILNRVQEINNYGFLLAEGTSLDITDQIGTGMTVRDAPVLRYFGEENGTRESINYEATSSQTGSDSTGSYTQYIYNYQIKRQDNDVKSDDEMTVDLSRIVVKVYDKTDSRGELVLFSIPEDAVPTFYPDIHKQFYYEELPVRLIYKVGLSEDTLNTLAKSGAIATQTFYTNAYDQYGTKVTKATFTPGANNPYYNSQTTTSRSKTTNVTNTYSKSFEEYMSNTVTGTVTQRLGNNGKLTVSRDNVTVISKKWEDVSETEANSETISVYIYREKQYEDGSYDGLEYVNSVRIDRTNNWCNMVDITDPGGTDDKGDYVWQYYLTEDLGKQYKYGVSYADEEGNLLDYVIRYQVPNWQTGQDPINMMRLYPLNGSVTITNRNRMLTINKVWADDTPDDQTVQVQIYRAATPLTGTSAATIYTLAATKEVSADSPLTYEARSYGMDTNLNAFYYDYYVAEVPVEGYAATYTDAEGNPVSPVKLTVDGKTVTVYPAVKNITITNTEVVPQTVVTKTWEDGYDAHSDYGDGVYVGLFAKVLSESTVTNSDTGEVTTEFEEEYLLKQRRYLNKLNDWSVTWQMDDVGTTYYAGGNKVKYTIEGYYVAEYLYTTSGYKPVYYRMEDDEQVRTDSVVTISQYTTVNGTATVMKDGVAADNTARYYTAQLAEPTALYPADESVIIHNVPENQLTVTKAWADGLTPEPVTVGIYPVAYDSNDDIVRLYHESQELGSLATDAGLSEDFQWSVTLSEENNWTYTWTNLPTSVVLKDPDTDEDVTYSFTYCVYEAQYDEDPYLPVYYDGNHKLITDMITDFEGIPILAVSRPDDGVVNIENVIRNSDLIIDKQWAGVDEEERTPVTMKLYREMLDAEGNVVEEATLLDTVQLSADNDWETTVSDLPYYKVEGAGSDKKVYTYRYYIGEVQNNTDYNVTYAVYPALEDEPTMKTMPDGQNACYVKFDESAATYNPIYSVTVTNAKSYVLPMTGSIGTNWYTWSGVAILLIVYTLYKLYWHRQRKRSKGGENESPIS